jgi:hypothetical protein
MARNSDIGTLIHNQIFFAMKHLLTIIIAIAPTVAAIAQEAGAKIKFEKSVHDYGTIDQHTDGGAEFVFVNEGTEPLIITNATGSCGCTVPEWSREPLAPGQKGSIKVMYDTKRVGNFQKTVTVTSNGSEEPIVLRIQGVVNEVAGGHDHHDHNHEGHDHNHSH